MTLCTDSNGAQRINRIDFVDPLTFLFSFSPLWF